MSKGLNIAGEQQSLTKTGTTVSKVVCKLFISIPVNYDGSLC